MSAQGRTTNAFSLTGTHDLTLDDPWLDLEMGADRALVSPSTLRREMKGGRLRFARVGGRKHIRIRASWIDDWLIASTTPREAGRG